MNFSELKELELKDLLKMLVDNKKDLLKLHLEARTGQLRANHKVKNLKKLVARICTALTYKSKIQ